MRKLVADGADVDRVDLRADHRRRPQRLRRSCRRSSSDQRRDGRVSIEVEPTLANDTEGTIASAQALWAGRRPAQRATSRSPATSEGLPAITAAIAAGHQRQRDPDLQLDALPRGHGRLPLRARAGPRQRPRPVAGSARWRRSSSRASTPRSTRGSTRSAATRRWRCAARPAVANARLAYAAFEEVIAGDRWQQLAAAGANPQRPLWASTGVKNPDYPDTLYVTDLVVADTVNTMPEKTLRRVRRPRRGQRRPGDRQGDAEAQALFDQLTEVGDRLDDVFVVLETEGVDKFIDVVGRAGRDRREADGAGLSAVSDRPGRRHDDRGVGTPRRDSPTQVHTRPARLVRRRPGPGRPADLRRPRDLHVDLSKNLRRRRGARRAARAGRARWAGRAPRRDVPRRRTSTSPRTARCCTPRCGCPATPPAGGRRAGRRRRRPRRARAGSTTSPTRSARAPGPASPASGSARWSTSASAVPTSGR